MNIENINDALKNEPKYRLKQAKEAVFHDLIGGWNEAGYLPLGLREKLNKECPLGIKGEVFKSDDGMAEKAVIVLDDNLKIESVLMRHQREPDESGPSDDEASGRNTVCVSSQAGCPMGCKFCATGESGFKRNLTVSEIVEQVLFFARPPAGEAGRGNKISNVVFMGMGEPFLNYENVMAAVRLLNGAEGMNMGARKISISTCGVVEGIEKLADEKLQVNLAVSLHAPDNELRSKLMPVNEKYPLEKVLAAVDDYIKKTSRRVMFEYLLIRDVNDSPNHARRLARIMKKPLYMVNLIKYNPAGGRARNAAGLRWRASQRPQRESGEAGRPFRPSDTEAAGRFKGILEKEGVAVTQRYRFGGGIKAACGQLAGLPVR